MKRATLFFTAILVPLDYTVLFLAALSAYALRFSPWFTDIRPITFTLGFADYLRIIAPLLLLVLFVLALSGLYATRRQPLAVEITRIILAISTSMAVILGIAFFSRELFDSRFIFLAAWLIATVFICLERLFIRLLERYLRKHGIGIMNVAILGKTHAGKELHAYFSQKKSLGWNITCIYKEFNKETRKRLMEAKQRKEIDAIIVADETFDRPTILAIKAFSDIEHIRFLYAAELVPGAVTQPIIHMFSGIPVVEVPKTPLDGWGAIYKRIFDIVFSLFLIFLSIPIQLLTAAALLLERQGGILFRQMRIGQSGNPFSYFKFRSMVKNAHAYRFDSNFLNTHGNLREGSPMFKLKNDPRVTKTGRFIRAFSIDEIPEFYLVLFGKMSLVGPRPHLPEEVAHYKPEQRQVFTIKPGITGLAQVSGRASLTFEEEVRLDMYYIENWSPWLDFIILLKTPFAVLLRDGDGAPRLH